jgi:gliding motility-associated lipoprotein GldH
MGTHRRLLNITVAALMLFALCACNKSVVYSKYETLPEAGWSSANKLHFDVEITDNQSLNNVFLTVRHADAYPYNNLFVFLTTQYPDGKKITDTLECVLANEKGEWKGDGAGDLWDNKIPLKQNVRFPLTGKYTFTFEQGMRVDPLPLILDFGMVIEKVK